MTCSRCRSHYDGLACDCFRTHARKEAAHHARNSFNEGASFYVTKSGCLFLSQTSQSACGKSGKADGFSLREGGLKAAVQCNACRKAMGWEEIGEN